MDGLKKLPARFYAIQKGKEPVRNWLRTLDDIDRKTVGIAIAKAEYGWPVGMPLVKALGHGLFEIRANLPSDRIVRIIFTIAGNTMVLLNGFVKKPRKIPPNELDLARRRAREIK